MSKCEITSIIYSNFNNNLFVFKKMSLNSKLSKCCITCSESKNVTELTSCDEDNKSFLEKLQVVTNLQLEFEDSTFICQCCCAELNTSFNFQEKLHLSFLPCTTNHKTFGGLFTLKKINSESCVICSQNKCLIELATSNENNESYLKKLQVLTNIQLSFEDFALICNCCCEQLNTSFVFQEKIQHTFLQWSNFCKEENIDKVKCKQTQYFCQTCDKHFQSISGFNRHKRSHKLPPGQKSKRSPVLCNVCGKHFPFSNGLKRHMRIHEGLWPFACKICGSKFRQSTHLQVHSRVHTGEKPYICETCGDTFSLDSALMKHRQRHKNIQNESS